jgi:hypothetical protein
MSFSLPLDRCVPWRRVDGLGVWSHSLGIRPGVKVSINNTDVWWRTWCHTVSVSSSCAFVIRKKKLCLRLRKLSHVRLRHQTCDYLSALLYTSFPGLPISWYHGRRHLLIYVDNFSSVASTSTWFFFKLSLTWALLHRRPRGGIELCSWCTYERHRRNMVLKLSRSCVLFLFFL